MNEISLANRKAKLRAELKLKRETLYSNATTEDLQAMAEGFCKQLANFCEGRDIRTVAAYLPYGTEPEIRPFLERLTRSAISILLPVAKPDRELHWVKWDGSSTSIGIHGFAEPVGQVAELAEADLIILPASAVDLKGNRLGKGLGYYDRALAKLETQNQKVAKKPTATVAVVFDHEVLPELPSEPHDRTVNAVITATQTITFDEGLN